MKSLRRVSKKLKVDDNSNNQKGEEAMKKKVDGSKALSGLKRVRNLVSEPENEAFELPIKEVRKQLRERKIDTTDLKEEWKSIVKLDNGFEKSTYAFLEDVIENTAQEVKELAEKVLYFLEKYKTNDDSSSVMAAEMIGRAIYLEHLQKKLSKQCRSLKRRGK